MQAQSYGIQATMIRSILTLLFMTLATQAFAQDTISMTCVDYDRTYPDGTLHKYTAEFRIEDRALEIRSIDLSGDLDHLRDHLIMRTGFMPVSQQQDNILLYDSWDEPDGDTAFSLRLIVRFNADNQKMDIVISGASVATTDLNKPLQPKGFLDEGQLDCKRKFFEESVIVDEAQPKSSSTPLTGGEKEAFSNQVMNCWAVNIGSRAANVSVIVSMDMQPDGKVVASSMEMIGYKYGNLSDAKVAFQAARRAILRCQRDGYDLPKDKYEHWRNIELTFDPNEWR